MPDIDTIHAHLQDTAHYHGQSYAAIVGVAAEIEAVDDKAARAALRREFRELHALTSQVWARVAKRFDNYISTKVSAQWIRAAAYCCQLPKEEGYELFNAHLMHINEPGALGLILRDVNDALDARRNGHGAKRATLAEQCAELHQKWNGVDQIRKYNAAYDAISDFVDELAALPAVASVLARRAKLAERAHVKAMRGYSEDLAEDARAIRAEAMTK